MLMDDHQLALIIILQFVTFKFVIYFCRNVSGYCCCLDGNGEVLEFLRLSSVHKRRNSFNEVERVQKVRLCLYSYES